jgi:hypothetical protein
MQVGGSAWVETCLLPACAGNDGLGCSTLHQMLAQLHSVSPARLHPWLAALRGMSLFLPNQWFITGC